MLTASTACQKTETRFDILSFKNPEASEHLSERFNPGSFAVNAHNNWDIVFEIPPTPLVVDPTGDSAATTTQKDASAQAPAEPSEQTPDSSNPQTLEPSDPPRVWMSQLIHINVFWRPRPGTTYAESTQTNATILYCLITGSDVIAYEGAGFVYFNKSRDGMTIKGRIESSDLVPTRFVNEPTDLFGPCRIEGSFEARRHRRHVMSILQQLRVKLPPR